MGRVWRKLLLLLTFVGSDVDWSSIFGGSLAVTILEEKNLFLLHDASSAVDTVAEGFQGEVLAARVDEAADEGGKKKK